MTRERRFHRFLPAAAALWLVPALPAVAQDGPLPDLFSEAIDVRVVNVEAVVTDRKGNRVRGLTANDFELLVDGEPAPIAYFTEIDEGTVRAAPAGAAEIAEAIPALHAGEPVGTNFLVFIDDFFSIRQHRDGRAPRVGRRPHAAPPRGPRGGSRLGRRQRDSVDGLDQLRRRDPGCTASGTGAPCARFDAEGRSAGDPPVLEQAGRSNRPSDTGRNRSSDPHWPRWPHCGVSPVERAAR